MSRTGHRRDNFQLDEIFHSYSKFWGGAWALKIGVPGCDSLSFQSSTILSSKEESTAQGAWISGWNPVFKKIFQNSQLIFTNKVYKNRPILMRFYVVCKGMWYYSIYLHIWPELEKLADLVYRVYTGIQFSSLACSHFFHLSLAPTSRLVVCTM